MVRTGSRQADRRVLLLGVCSETLTAVFWWSGNPWCVPAGGAKTQRSGSLLDSQAQRSSLHTSCLGLLRVSSVYFCQSSGKTRLSVLSCLHFSAS